VYSLLRAKAPLCRHIRGNLLGEKMKFTISHIRALSGNDISVKVEAENDQSIQSVLTRLDGFQIANDVLASPNDVYERAFKGTGTAGIGNEHTLIVTVELEDGNTHSATSIWTDPS
jgi:hypothetical protein